MAPASRNFFHRIYRKLLQLLQDPTRPTEIRNRRITSISSLRNDSMSLIASFDTYASDFRISITGSGTCSYLTLVRKLSSKYENYYRSLIDPCLLGVGPGGNSSSSPEPAGGIRSVYQNKYYAHASFVLTFTNKSDEFNKNMTTCPHRSNFHEGNRVRTKSFNGCTAALPQTVRSHKSKQIQLKN